MSSPNFGGIASPNRSATIGPYGFVVGDISIRQYRVVAQECDLPAQFKDVATTCVPDYTDDNEDTESYGSGSTGFFYVTFS